MTIARLVLWDTDVQVRTEDLVVFRNHEDAELYEIGELTRTQRSPLVILTELSPVELGELLCLIGIRHGIRANNVIANIDKSKTHGIYDLVHYIKHGVKDSEVDFDALIDSIELGYLKNYLRSYYDFRCKLLCDLITTFYRQVKERSYKKILNTVPPSGVIDNFVARSKQSDRYPNSLKDIILSYKDVFKVLSETDIERKAYYLSAYFCALAKTYYRKEESQDSSLLLIHRSVEMFLLSLAIEAGLIQSTENGFRFKYSDDTRLVGVHALATELNSIGNISFSSQNWDFIRKLNSMRNLSFYTHGVFAYRVDELQNCLDQTSELVRDINGNAAWHSLVERLTISILPFHDRDSRSLEDINQYYEEHSQP